MDLASNVTKTVIYIDFIQPDAYFVQIKPFLFDILTKSFKFAEKFR